MDDVTRKSTEEIVDIVKEYLSDNHFDSIHVDIQDFTWHNDYSITKMKKGVMNISPDISNSKLNANVLEIIGYRLKECRDNGSQSFEEICPCIRIYRINGTTTTSIKEYDLKSKDDVTKALGEILIANSNTSQITPSSNLTDSVTKQLETIIRVLNLIEGHTRPPAMDKERQ